ncbi:MAG: C25 family cysteine peptidase [Candidatus Shapirobacteria bacterium]|jgi:sugar lactone lactonase YvrE
MTNDPINKYHLIFLSIGVIVLSLAVSAINTTQTFSNQAASATNTLRFTYHFSSPQITSSVSDSRYSQIKMDNTKAYDLPGQPIVPLKDLKILIPSGKKFKSAVVNSGSKITLPGQYLLQPGQKDYPLLPKEELTRLGLNPAEPTLPDPLVYSQSTAYPSSLSSSSNLQSMFGYQILLLSLYPLEYLPSSLTVSYYSSMTLTITLEPATTAQSLLSPLPSDTNKVKNFVDNPDLTSTYTTSARALSSSRTRYYSRSAVSRLSATPSSYTYVIITPSRFVSGFTPLVNYKNRKGVTAKIVTTEDIYANYSGTRPDGQTDNQTKIRNFIIDAYQHWQTRFILLGGDADGQINGGETEEPLVPVRYFAERDPIPSDVYYSNLDGTLDGNQNGQYGEMSDGSSVQDVDFLPEVAVGRAPVDSLEEIQNFVNKTISYSDTTDPYLQSSYLAGEYLGFGGIAQYAGPGLEEIHRGSDVDYYTTAGLDGSLYFDNRTLYDDEVASWPKEKLKTLINTNLHLINHLGHGNLHRLAKLEYNPPVVNDLAGLTNSSPFLIYSQACYSGSFDNFSSSEFSSVDSIAENMVTLPHAAFAALVNSRYGYGFLAATGGPSHRYHREFWDAVFAENISILGEINNDSKIDNVWRINESHMRYIYYTLNLLGDPQITLITSGIRNPLAARLSLAENHAWIGQNSVKELSVQALNLGSRDWTPATTQLGFTLPPNTFTLTPGTLPGVVSAGHTTPLFYSISTQQNSPPTGVYSYSFQMRHGSAFFGPVINQTVEVVPYTEVKTFLPDKPLSRPRKIAVDSLGNIYVADSGNSRIVKFDPQGNFILTWGSVSNLTLPSAVAVDSANRIYVGDQSTTPVRIYDSEGKYLSYLRIPGAEKSFTVVGSIAISPVNQMVYVLDSKNNTIYKFNSQGSYLSQISSYGASERKFEGISDIAINSHGVLSVIDSVAFSILDFDTNDRFLRRWSDCCHEDGLISSSQGITYDSADNILIADTGNNRIQKLSPDRKFLLKWGTPGGGGSQFNEPVDVTAGRSGQIYVSDSGNNRLQVFYFSNLPSFSSVSLDSFPGGPGPYQAYVTFTDQANYFWQNLLKGTTSYFRSVPPRGDGTPDFTRAGSWQTITTNTILPGNTSPFDAATTFKERSGTLWQNFILGNNSHFRTIPPKADGTPDWSNASAWSVLSLGTLPLPSSGNLSYATYVDPQGTLTQILIRGQEGIYRFIPPTSDGKFNWSSPSPWHNLTDSYSYYLGNLTLPIDSYDMVLVGNRIIQNVTQGNTSYYRYLEP